MSATELQCREPRCTDNATWHVEYREGGSHVVSHFCGYHSTTETARFERAFGAMASSRPLSNDCRRGRC